MKCVLQDADNRKSFSCLNKLRFRTVLCSLHPSSQQCLSTCHTHTHFAWRVSARETRDVPFIRLREGIDLVPSVWDLAWPGASQRMLLSALKQSVSVPSAIGHQSHSLTIYWQLVSSMEIASRGESAGLRSESNLIEPGPRCQCACVCVCVSALYAL